MRYHVRVSAGMSVNIKYTVALFSALDDSVRKKTCDLHDFLCILHETAGFPAFLVFPSFPTFS